MLSTSSKSIENERISFLTEEYNKYKMMYLNLLQFAPQLDNLSMNNFALNTSLISLKLFQLLR